ncbi:hypothetical protein SAMN04488511_10368 [Pedobacter suwonensis]|uniref:Uncharacterized protein n=1 Tax=Pedobacter suwonensis TaxID=332999 RepID=A0A1I0SSF3_9SPHI|nr:hypothetical protein SAMN04488511_10368 [Pedobacter suwonensis]
MRAERTKLKTRNYRMVSLSGVGDSGVRKKVYTEERMCYFFWKVGFCSFKLR